jgi:hypothetical protein
MRLNHSGCIRSHKSICMSYKVVNRLCCGYAKHGAHPEDSAGQPGGHINKTQSIRYSWEQLVAAWTLYRTFFTNKDFAIGRQS